MTKLQNKEITRENTDLYKHGYSNSITERQIHEENRRGRKTNNSLGNGIKIGLILSCIAALGVGSYLFANRKQETPSVPLPSESAPLNTEPRENQDLSKSRRVRPAYFQPFLDIG